MPDAGGWKGPQPGDPSPVLYFAGSCSARQEEYFAKSGWRFRCLSYAYIGSDSPNSFGQKVFDICVEHGMRIMLDSGAFTLQKVMEPDSPRGRLKALRKKNKEELVELFISRYAEFVRKHGDRFDFSVTLDYVRHCPTIYQVTRRLKGMGAPVVPVYHGDMSVDWLERYVDEGHKLVCVGLAPRDRLFHRNRYFYDQVFNFAVKRGIHLHGLALTDLDYLFSYPWYSVDSATWIWTAAYGEILLPWPEGAETISWRKVPVSVHRGPIASVRELEQEVSRRGMELRELRSSRRARALFNIKVFMELLEKKNCERKVCWTSLV